jgi:hypothetical protein
MWRQRGGYGEIKGGLGSLYPTSPSSVAVLTAVLRREIARPGGVVSKGKGEGRERGNGVLIAGLLMAN